MQRSALSLVLTACLVACGDPAEDFALTPCAESSRQTMFEKWSQYDNPDKLGPLEHRYAALPTKGHVTDVPWAGSSYPVYLDSINYRAPGVAESAAQKYERAFGGSGIERTITAMHGTGHARGGGCTADDQCEAASRCARRAGKSAGSCVPYWWGLGHGWAAAATVHPEPWHAVVHNGVRFEVADIKALLTLAYDTAHTTQISLRSDVREDLMSTDLRMRPTDLVDRDTNPGTYHILLANRIGLQHLSFIQDRDPTRKVVSVPLRSYEVLSQTEVDARKANALLGLIGGSYTYNVDAKRWLSIKTRVDFTQPCHADAVAFAGGRADRFTGHDTYEYLLELDAAGIIIGGEWLGNSKRWHPDFVWVAHGPQGDTVARGKISIRNILDLARRSAEDPA